MRALRFALALMAAPLAAPLMAAFAGPAHAQIAVGLSITVAPPALPIYVQPPLPAEGYIWTPGYWAYGDDGYYWVPGVWVQPPAVGLLWTPGYWGWNNGFYVFNRGYWGPHVGFYGGINYGYGYNGFGYGGGEWRGGAFAYNRAVNNFGGTHVTNVYNQTVINNNSTHVSFNGPNGIAARPSAQEEAFQREQHVEPSADQQRHFEAAAHEPALRATANGGHPPIAAVARPGEFHGPGVVAARGPAAPVGGPRPQVQAEHPQAQAQRAQVQHQQAQRPQPQRTTPQPRPQQVQRQQAPRPQPQRQQVQHQQAAPHPAAAPRPQAQHAAPHEGGHRG